MKNIAILTCLRACNVCTGALCLDAYNGKTKSFAAYSCEDTSLRAFMHCNGCDNDPDNDSGMDEKLARLKKIGVDTVHLGVCTVMGRPDDPNRHVCPTITKLEKRLIDSGISVVHGTH
ncbi:MAG: CGGC domain-containing protein [Oscillospiraceae bacterium]|nr:CGGC domain-containing protein [Oscillospiraceae bacterium]